MSEQTIPTIPATAVAFPYYPLVAYAMPVIIANFQEGLEHENQQAASIYGQACANWTLANGLNREKGLPIQPKPVAPPMKVANVYSDEAQTVRLWVTLGGPVGPPCPDLPPLPPTPPAGNVSIGRHIVANWWAALLDDTAPTDYTFTVPPAAHNVPNGTYRKIKSPFGGYWEKTA